MLGLLGNKKAIVAFVISCMCLIDWHAALAVTREGSLRNYLLNFKTTRNDRVNNNGKKLARQYLVDTFTSLGMHTWTESFSASGTGVNVIGRVNGRFSGSRDDQVLIIGAHYDTAQSTPGVDDNGSGVVAMLQAARQYLDPDMKDCQRNFTLIFVAFDKKECQNCGDRDLTKCICSYGSLHFVRNFTSYLVRSRGVIQGAIILDSVMNYDNSADAQNITADVREYFPGEAVTSITKNEYRGDFLMVIGRHPGDKYLIGNFTKYFNLTDSYQGKFKVTPLTFTLQQRPSLQPSFAQITHRQLYRSDHYRFWDHDPPVNAIYLTDTADLRGYMRYCYHNDCDDMAHVTTEMYGFLGNTADTLALTARRMTQEYGCVTRALTNISEHYTSNSGQFHSPGYPTRYPNNADCAWSITVSAGRKVELKFTDFVIEDSGCIRDYVDIRDGANNAGKLISRLCGGKIPSRPLISSGQHLSVLFHSDQFESYKGFNAKWSLYSKGSIHSQHTLGYLCVFVLSRWLLA